MFTLNLSFEAQAYLIVTVEAAVIRDAVALSALDAKKQPEQHARVREDFIEGAALLGQLHELHGPARPDIFKDPAPADDELEAEPSETERREGNPDDPAVRARAADPRCVHGVRFAEPCGACDAYTLADAQRAVAEGAKVFRPAGALDAALATPIDEAGAFRAGA